MADEQVEAVAKALYEFHADPDSDDRWEVYTDPDYYREQARAALAALFPPPFKTVALEHGVCLIDGGKPSQERLFSILSRWLAVGGQYQEEASEK